jgi:hypothetical protein
MMKHIFVLSNPSSTMPDSSQGRPNHPDQVIPSAQHTGQLLTQMATNLLQAMYSQHAEFEGRTYFHQPLQQPGNILTQHQVAPNCNTLQNDGCTKTPQSTKLNRHWW